jgi:hypothetical protein
VRRRSGLILAAIALCGCGGHARAKPVVCVPAARPLLAARLGVPATAISQAVTTGNNGMPQCVLTAARAGERPVQLTVNLDNGPQAYFRLERTAIEASQQFGTVRLYAPPEQIPGLGMEADWFPDADNLETTDGLRLITVTIAWPGSKQAERRRLAEALARPFLMRPHGGATGYPSG